MCHVVFVFYLLKGVTPIIDRTIPVFKIFSYIARLLFIFSQARNSHSPIQTELRWVGWVMTMVQLPPTKLFVVTAQPPTTTIMTQFFFTNNFLTHNLVRSNVFFPTQNFLTRQALKIEFSIRAYFIPTRRNMNPKTDAAKVLGKLPFPGAEAKARLPAIPCTSLALSIGGPIRGHYLYWAGQGCLIGC